MATAEPHLELTDEASVEQIYNSLKHASNSDDQTEADNFVLKLFGNTKDPHGNIAKKVVFLAAKDNDGLPSLRAIEKALGVDLFLLKDENKNSVVHIAAEHQTVQTYHFITSVLPSEHMYILRARGQNGCTPVHCAARNKTCPSFLECLVNEKEPECLTDSDDDNNTPIHIAAKFHKAETMQFIKEKMNGVECFQALGNENRTAVHYAAWNTVSSSALKWLVNELGPGCLTDKDYDDDTVIHIAAEFQKAETMQFIKEKMDGVECFQMRGNENRTAVHCAAQNTISISALKWLVNELGPDCLTDTEDDNFTALDIACVFQTAETIQAIKEKMKEVKTPEGEPTGV